MNTKRRLAFVYIGMFILLQGCSQQQNQAENGSVVVWSELRVLDELSESAIQYNSQNQTAALRDTAGMLLKAGQLVVNAEPPANAVQPEQVKLLQSDLQGLVNDEPDSLTDEELFERVQAIHAIALKLMEAAGMPHVHDDHDDHEDHNH